MQQKKENNINLRWIIAIGSIILATCISVLITQRHQNPDIACRKCNIILVSLDSLSSLHLPCYGYDKNTAPNLCKFGTENWLFENSYSQSPYTLSSHFSIFTSLYPHTHKMVNVRTGNLEEKHLTLAQILRSNGYQTIYHGPLNDIHLPLNRGIERGFNTIRGGSVINWGESLKELKQNNNKNVPTFLFLHTYDVHEPYIQSGENRIFENIARPASYPSNAQDYYTPNNTLYPFCADLIMTYGYHDAGYRQEVNRHKEIARKMAQSKDNAEQEKLFLTMSRLIRGMCIQSWRNSIIDKYNKNHVDYLKTIYDEKILELDNKLTELFQFISQPDIAKNTILIITSDHGQEFMENGELYHANNLHRTSTAVPLIISVPDSKPRRIKELVQSIDIYPTILALTSIKPQAEIEGISMKEIMEGKKNPRKNQYLMGEFKNILAFQSGEWRYYYDNSRKQFFKLYNVKTDPLEQKNLINEFPNMPKSLLEQTLISAVN